MKLPVYVDELTIYIDIDRESDVASRCAILQSRVDSFSPGDKFGKPVMNLRNRKL